MTTSLYVEPLQPVEFETCEKVPGVYKYTGLGKAKWIQRVCFWILSKLDCEYVRGMTGVSTTSFDMQDVLGLVYKNRSLIERYYRGNFKYLIVGADKQAEVMKSDPIHFTMQVPPDFKTPTGPSRLMFAGLWVIFVPYMNGITLLEELPQ
jgi:hypothetical protein